MPTAYSYCRVSTPQQAESGAGLDAQKSAIQQHYETNLKPKGFEWAGFFIDPAVSGSIPFNNRPAGGELAKQLQKGDRIVVAKWDRAFRSMRDMCITVEGWVTRGVRASVLDMPVDIFTDEGMLIAQMFTAIAEFERKRMRQRIREALAARKAQGRPVNRFAGHGFKWVRNGSGLKQRIADEHDRRVMARIVELRLENFTWENIYFELLKQQVKTSENREWSLSRIRRAYQAAMKLTASELTMPSLELDSRPETQISAPTVTPSPTTIVQAPTP
jgi:DNA invertase Pin-like site-specific DNA recombinase